MNRGFHAFVWGKVFLKMHSPSNHTLLRKGNEEFQVMNTLFAYGLKFPKICKAEENFDLAIWDK